MSNSHKAVFTSYIAKSNILKRLQFIMHPISSAQKENILSLDSNGFSNHHIASKLGVGRSTVARKLHDLFPNHHNPLTGCPSKLSSTGQHAVIAQIKTGKASNVVQAMKHINTIISHPVSSQTLKRVLKKHSFKAVVKKNALAYIMIANVNVFCLLFLDWIWSEKDRTLIVATNRCGCQIIAKFLEQGLNPHNLSTCVRHSHIFGFGGGECNCLLQV